LSGLICNSVQTGIIMISSITVGSSTLNINPSGIINFANSLNSLMLFQLIYFDKYFPSNINSMMNASSLISFGNFPQLYSFSDASSVLSNPLWLENNIINFNLINGPSYIINIVPTFEIIGLLIIVLFFSNGFLYQSSLLRRIKQTLNINNILMLFYQSTFFQFTISSLVSSFYDTTNYDYFSFISQILSFIMIFVQIFITFYFALRIFENKKRLLHPDVEESFGDLYWNLKISNICVYSNLIDNLKFQLIMLFLFIFQNLPTYSIISTSLIYTISLIYILYVKPFESTSNFMQAIIKETLMIAISVMFGLLKILIEKAQPIDLYQEMLLFLFVGVLVNEFFFQIIQYLYILQDIFSSLRKKQSRTIKRIKITTFEDILDVEQYQNFKTIYGQMKNDKSKFFASFRNDEELFNTSYSCWKKSLNQNHPRMKISEKMLIKPEFLRKNKLKPFECSINLGIPPGENSQFKKGKRILIFKIRNTKKNRLVRNPNKIRVYNKKLENSKTSEFKRNSSRIII